VTHLHKTNRIKVVLSFNNISKNSKGIFADYS